MKPLIYIDGAAGTTGLELRDRLAERSELTVRVLPEEERKTAAARAQALNEADIAVLCLPDQAAREAVALLENPAVRILDASSAHRTAEGWVYGFPELAPGQRAAIANGRRVSNPGCYATGFLALVAPLVRAGILPPGYPVTATGISGDSGGGRAMIAQFEDRQSPRFTPAVVRPYALDLAHKHVREMQMHAGLSQPPLFAPMVARFYRGMMVDVPLQLWSLPKKPEAAEIYETIAAVYANASMIDVAGFRDQPETLDVGLFANTDRMKLFVFGNGPAGQARLVAILDNLGKGAAGAAVQNINLMLGLEERSGLR